MSLFTITHRHVHHFDHAAAEALGEVRTSLGSIDNKLRTIMLDTSKLLAAVAREKTDNDSLRALVEANTKAITQLSADLATAIANNDPVAMQKVQDDLDKAATDLSVDSDKTEAALAANVSPPSTTTPAPPAPSPVDSSPATPAPAPTDTSAPADPNAPAPLAGTGPTSNPS